MRSVRRSLLVLCMVAPGLVPACHCGRETENAAEAPSAAVAEPVPREAEVLRAIEALGDEGAVVLVLRPQHWSALHEAVAPWLAELPPPAAALVGAAREPAALPGLLAHPLGLPAGSITLEGWDVGRPVVASLGEVPYDGPPGTVGFGSLSQDTRTHEGRPVTVLGLGGESAAAFDEAKDERSDALLHARVSLARIGAGLAEREPELGARLGRAGELRLTLEHRRGALLGELAWAPGAKEVAAKAVPVTSGERTRSPTGSRKSEAPRCLADAGRGAARGLEALTAVAEDQLATVASSTLREMEPRLGCAASDSTTRQAAASLRRLVVRLFTDAMVARYQHDAALALLDAQCKQSEDEVVCALAKQHAAPRRPSP